MLGSLIIYLKGMRRRMFQLSGFYLTGESYISLGLGFTIGFSVWDLGFGCNC